MKLKRFIFNTFLFIFVCAGVCGAVCYANYVDYQNKLSKPATNDAVTAPVSAEQTVLNNLITNITTAEKMSGTVNVFSSDQKVNVKLYLHFANTATGIRLSADIMGKFNGTEISAQLTYLNGIAYLNAYNTKIKVSTSDAFGLVTQLLNSGTNNELTSVLDTDKLLEAVNGMTTEEQADGSQVIKLTVPNLCTLSVWATANGVPKTASITNLTVGAQNINVNAIFTPTSNSEINVNESEYSPIEITQETTNIISNILEVAKNFNGVELSGNISVKGLANIETTVFIDKSLTLKAILNCSGITATIYYKNKNIYLEFMNNCIKLTASELLQFLNDTLGIGVGSTLNFSVVNDSVVLNENTITFAVGEDCVVGAHATGNNYVADLVAYKYYGTVSVPEIGNYQTVTLKDLNVIYNQFKQLATAKEYSFDFEGTVSGKSVFVNGYISTKKNFSGVNSFALKGTFNGNYIGFYYCNNYYYININNAKAKFSSACATQMYEYIVNYAGVGIADGLDIVKFINKYAVNLNYYGGNTFSLETSVGSATLVLRGNFADISLNNLQIAGISASGSIKLYEGNKLNLLSGVGNIESYTNLSSTTSLAKSIANTLKQDGRSLSGYLYLTTEKIELLKIGVKVTTYYSNATPSIKIELTNLPTSAFVSNYSSLLYYNSRTTITLTPTAVKLEHKITNIFTTISKTDVNSTYSYGELTTEVLAKALGIKQSLINKVSDSQNSSSLNIGELCNGIALTNKQLSINLKNGLSSLGCTAFDAKINYKNNLVTSININAEIMNLHLAIELD